MLDFKKKLKNKQHNTARFKSRDERRKAAEENWRVCNKVVYDVWYKIE